MSRLSRAATATTTTMPRMLAIVHRLCSVEDMASVWCIAYPPSLARPRCRPPMMIVACSIVVRSAPSGAVLCTAWVSAPLIFGASLPIERASSRMGTTSATTTRTITMPIVKPITQPVVLVPAAVPYMSCSFGSSDRFAEVADRLQAGVDRGEPLGHRAGQIRDGLHPAGGRDEGRADRAEMEDDPEQADRGDRDDQRRDDQCHPGSCWHGCFSFPAQPRSFATEPAYRTAPLATSLTVSSVVASASGTPWSSPTRATPPDRISSVAPRIRSSAASTRLSRKMTTGSMTTSRTALLIHHQTMARLPSGRVGPVRQEEAGEDPLERHHRGPHPQREPARGRGGSRLRRGFAALGGVDPGRHVGREVTHEHRGDVGDHAPAVLGGRPGELQVLGDADLGTAAGPGQH